MGNWVTARCRKRVKDTSERMPQAVRDWLDTGGNSPADDTTQPSPYVLGWLVKTIEKPIWDT